MVLYRYVITHLIPSGHLFPFHYKALFCWHLQPLLEAETRVAASPACRTAHTQPL